MRSRPDSFLSKFKRRQQAVSKFFRNTQPLYDEVVVTVRSKEGGDFTYKAQVKRPSVLIGIISGQDDIPAISPESPDRT